MNVFSQVSWAQALYLHSTCQKTHMEFQHDPLKKKSIFSDISKLQRCRLASANPALRMEKTRLERKLGREGHAQSWYSIGQPLNFWNTETYSMRSDPEAIAHHPLDMLRLRPWAVMISQDASQARMLMFFSQWLGCFIEEKVSNKLAWDFMRIFVGVSCQFTAWAFWDLHRHIAAFWKKQRFLDMILAGSCEL